jgi:hypothetical protein
VGGCDKERVYTMGGGMVEWARILGVGGCVGTSGRKGSGESGGQFGSEDRRGGRGENIFLGYSRKKSLWEPYN